MGFKGRGLAGNSDVDPGLRVRAYFIQGGLGFAFKNHSV